MSWPQWPGGGVPQPPLLNSTPNVLNPTSTSLMPTSQYTPEQWAQMQQQNWQQWAQWQQQFQQWQQQYGAEYQKSLNALAQGRTTQAQPSMPIFNNPSAHVPPPLPKETKPPLPPEEPKIPVSLQPQSFTAPPPAVPIFSGPPPTSQNQFLPHQQQNAIFTNQQNSTQNQRTNDAFSKNPQQSSGHQNFTRHSERESQGNWRSNNISNLGSKSDFRFKRGHNQPNYSGIDAKRNKIEHNERWTPGENQNQQPNKNWNDPPQSQQLKQTTESSISKSNPEELTEAEKKFDKQFAEWEAQFQKWKEQNANHPDKNQYREYEKKWETWRAQLLDRREQMRRKRLGLTSSTGSGKSLQSDGSQIIKSLEAGSSQDASSSNFQPGVKLNSPSQTSQGGFQPCTPQRNFTNIDKSNPQPLVLNANDNKRQQPEQQQQGGSSPEVEIVSFTRPPPHINNQPLIFKKPNSTFIELESDKNILKTELHETDKKQDSFIKSIESIPGLDLVETPSKEDTKPDEEQQKKPDLEAISRGLNSILGDQKLLNMLSLVSQAQISSTTSQSVSTSSIKTNSSPPQIGFVDTKNNEPSKSDEVLIVDEQTQNSRVSVNHEQNNNSNFGQDSSFSRRVSTSDYFERNDNQNRFYQQDKFNRNINLENRNSNNSGWTEPYSHNEYGSGNNFNNRNKNENYDRGSGNANFNNRDDNVEDFNSFQRFDRDSNNFYKNSEGSTFNRSSDNCNRNFGDFNRRPPQNDFKPGSNFRSNNFERNLESRNNFMENGGGKESDNVRDGPNVPRGMNNFGRDTEFNVGTPNVQPQNQFIENPSQWNNTPSAVKELSESEEIWKPTNVVDYDHKTLKTVEPEIILEPIYAFDYRHKPLNRIPYPQRPKWVTEMVKRYPELDRTASRFEPQQIRRYPINERYQNFGDNNRMPFENRNKKSHGGVMNRKSFDTRSSDFSRKPSREYDDKRPPSDDEVPSKKLFSGASCSGNNVKSESNTKIENMQLSPIDDYYESIEDSPPFMDKWDTKDEIKTELDDVKFKTNNPTFEPIGNKLKVTLIEDLLNQPGRYHRPPRLVIILRGPPGSGKSFLAKLIKDKEVENGGSAPRIICLDDYFMVEQDKEIEEDGRKIKTKEMVYEYEEDMEESYRNSLMKSFKKTITDGYFNFIIVDNINDKVKYFGEMWSFAKQNGFQVYICQLELDVQTCTKRNIHNRTEAQIQKCVNSWETTPAHHPLLDATSLIQSGSIPEVEMEEINSPPSSENMNEEEHFTSKWDNFDYSIDNLAKLDGTNKPLRHSRTMEDYLQLEDEWIQPTSKKPGQKRVRWADLEERKKQEKMRAIGFVVGQTNWDIMMNPTAGDEALTQTKYIERYN